MIRVDDTAGDRRRRAIDEWDREDNRAIAYILIGLLVATLIGLGLLVLLDVTDDGAPAADTRGDR